MSDDGTARQSKFRRQGLGYVYDTENFRLTISRLKRSSESASGYLYVECTQEGMAGALVANRFNLDSLVARKSQAAHLASKTNGMQVDWADILDRFCLYVARSEHSHENFTTVGDMEDTVKTQWLVNNIVLEGQTSTLFAPGGTGKSFFGLAVGLSVQTGKEIISGFKPARQGHVLYCDYETVRSDVDARVKALCNGAGFPSTRIGYLRCTDSIGDMVEEIARYVASEGTALVILDSVEMALSHQREASDANQAIIDLYRALRLLNTSVLLIDHVNAAEASKTKGNRRPYGSIYKVNLARIAFEIRLGSTDGDIANIALYNIKRNDGRLLRPVGLKMQFGEDSVYYAKQDITEDKVLADGLGNKDKLQAAVKRANRTVTVKEMAEELELTQGTVRDLFNELEGTVYVRMEQAAGKATHWGLKFPF